MLSLLPPTASSDECGETNKPDHAPSAPLLDKGAFGCMRDMENSPPPQRWPCSTSTLTVGTDDIIAKLNAPSAPDTAVEITRTGTIGVDDSFVEVDLF